MIEENKCYIDEIKEWIRRTEGVGYIDCVPCPHDDEFDFIIGMAKNLLKELEQQ